MKKLFAALVLSICPSVFAQDIIVVPDVGRSINPIRPIDRVYVPEPGRSVNPVRPIDQMPVPEPRRSYYPTDQYPYRLTYPPVTNQPLQIGRSYDITPNGYAPTKWSWQNIDSHDGRGFRPQLAPDRGQTPYWGKRR